jgi:carbonic anhydrase/acetyltransferase-like protein (isoleucine patch superfamily)
VLRGDEEIVIGEDTNVQDLSMMHADPGFPAVLEDRVTVGHRAIVHGATVEDDVLVGMGAILLNGARIGSGSVIAAGAVVTPGPRSQRTRSWWGFRQKWFVRCATRTGK